MLAISSGMIDGMTVSKIAVSLPAEVVEHVRRAVRRGAAPSVSAYVAQALAEKEQRDPLDTLLEEMIAASGGPLTEEELREADRVLGYGPPRRPRARARRST